MPEPKTPAAAGARRRQLAHHLLVPLGVLLVVVLLQWHYGAYENDFGSHPDEAAHVVTGLMLHDFIVGLHWTHPMSFAENYYLHYPKVAIGHWPPFFYIVQSLWMVAFGASRVSLRLLMAVICTAVSTLIYGAGRRHLPAALAAAAALLFAVVPIVEWLSMAIMTEILMTLLIFAATLAFARYLETDRPYRWSIAFALLASLAILTKGTGLILALVPIFGLLLTRRFDCLRRFSFWLPAIVIGVLCGPWHYYTLNMQTTGGSYTAMGLRFVYLSFPYYSHSMVRTCGYYVTGLALAGIVHRVVLAIWEHGRAEPFWAALTSLLGGAWLFHVLVPCGLEDRHLIVAIPALVLLAADGAAWAGNLLGKAIPGRPRLAAAIVGGLSGLLILAEFQPFVRTWRGDLMVTEVDKAYMYDFQPYYKPWRGFDKITSWLEQEPWRNSIVLVSSDTPGEGMLIADVALNDTRPNRFILRASNVLASSNWTGGDYRQRFTSSEDLLRFCRSTPIDLVVMDTSIEPADVTPHHKQLLDVIHDHPRDWRLVGTFPITRDGHRRADAIQVFALNLEHRPPVANIEVNLKAELGRNLRTSFVRPGSEPATVSPGK